MLVKVLVPLDGSPESAVALPPAQTLVKKIGSSLKLLRVVASEPPAPGLPWVPEATAYLQRIADELALDSVHVETAVRYGDVSSEVLPRSPRPCSWSAQGASE